MANRQRNIRIQLRVTEQEKELIERKMQELGTKNTEAYLHKMTIDGFIINLVTADVRELFRVLPRKSCSDWWRSCFFRLDYGDEFVG